MLVKRSWGRLGAAISAMALLAGGLLGVAAPANAGELDDTTGLGVCFQELKINLNEEVAKRKCKDDYSREYVGYTIILDKTDEVVQYWGTRIEDETPPKVDIDCDPFSYSDNTMFCYTFDGVDGDDEAKSKILNDVCDFAVANFPPDYVDAGEERTEQKGKNRISCKVKPQPIGSSLPIETDDCDPDSEILVDGKCEIRDPDEKCPEGQIAVEDKGCVTPDGSGAGEPVQKSPPPPPCWSAEALNNCPVGGALRFAAPPYAMVGVPLRMTAYASWRPDANSPAQPTNGTAVIRVDGEDYAGVEFVDGIAEWRFIPETEGMKEFTASGVLFSGLSGANAYIDTVPARTYVLEYDPAAYAMALKNKRVEVGDTYVITDPNQARSYAEGRYEWSVSSKSEDVCAVYETKKGAVKAKFTDSGKCTVIWLDKESEESGKYTFIAKK